MIIVIISVVVEKMRWKLLRDMMEFWMIFIRVGKNLKEMKEGDNP